MLGRMLATSCGVGGWDWDEGVWQHGRHGVCGRADTRPLRQRAPLLFGAGKASVRRHAPPVIRCIAGMPTVGSVAAVSALRRVMVRRVMVRCLLGPWGGTARCGLLRVGLGVGLGVGL